jgi:hypothetical protein
MKGHCVASSPTKPHLSTNVKRHCISPTNRPTAVRKAKSIKISQTVLEQWDWDKKKNTFDRLHQNTYNLRRNVLGSKYVSLFFCEVCSTRASSRQVRHKLRSICAEKRVLRSSCNVFDTRAQIN